MYWDDINVVLLGTLDQGCLEENLRGPPLHVEIHDRDRKMENRKVKADLFGNNPDDEMINNVSLVAGTNIRFLSGAVYNTRARDKIFKKMGFFWQ